MTYPDIKQLLSAVRMGLARLTPRQALRAQAGGARLVDIRPEYQRRADGELPGAIVIERNHLEWRLDPRSRSRIAEATGHDVHWVIICDQGFASSLAAAGLHAMGLAYTTDVAGGFQRWRADGCPVVHPQRPFLPRIDRRDRRLG